MPLFYPYLVISPPYLVVFRGLSFFSAAPPDDHDDGFSSTAPELVIKPARAARNPRVSDRAACPCAPLYDSR